MIDLNSARLRIVWLAVFLCGYYSMPAQAATPLCGTTLTSNTTLDSDMICPGRAISFSQQSKNVVLDCKGFTISSDSDRIISANAVSRITIKNCSFLSIDDGIRAIVFTGVTKSKVINNTITTTGDGSSAFDIRGDSSSNLFSNNRVHTSGSNSNAFRVRAGSNKNIIKNNVFEADASYAVNIQSAASNGLTGNTLISPNGFLYQGKYSLQNGGISVDPSGNIFAVENNWGSSAGDGAGIGEATAFFQVDPATGTPISVIPLLRGRKDVGFGFDALEILPNGRVLALRGCCTDSYLFEIDPISGKVTEIEIDLPPGSEGSLNGLEAIDNSNLLATTNQGNLISIDLDAGTMALIGDQNKGWTGIAIHPTTGEVYTVSRQRNETSRTAHLYKIDINDGQVITEIGDTGSSAISGIDFAPDGTLYGSYDLESIDINTGVSTTVGDFGPDPLEPRSKKNFLKSNLLQTTNGSLRYPGKIVLPSVGHVDMSADMVSITDNQVLVESAELPFLDERARIVLEGLPGTYRNLLIDPEDDGSFVPCGSSKCKFVSFMDGTLVFDVKGFTTYSSEENSSPDLLFVANTVRAEIKALVGESETSKSAGKKLKAADKDMAKALKFLKKDKFKSAFTHLGKAVTDLVSAAKKGAGADPLIDKLLDAAKAEAQLSIDTAVDTNGDAALIAQAQANMDKAQTELEQGKPDKAVSSYRKAWDTARKAAKAGGGLSFNPVNVPGTYDSLWSDDPVGHEFIFSANNTGTVDFGFGGPEDFTWSVDGQGRLLVDLGGGGLPDRYTLTSGTIKSGTFSAEVDDDSNGGYEFFPTVDIVETAGGGGGSANFGSLTIIGADTGVIGENFTPGSVMPPPGVIIWDSISAEAVVSLVVSGVLDLDPATGAVVFNFVRQNPSAAFGYEIQCDETPAECAKISVNEAAKTIFFDNVELTNPPNSSGTAPIVFNGTLHTAPSTALKGTAAAGAPIIGTVTVKGSLGNTRSALIEANGNYNVDVTGLTAPFRLRAQGTVGGRTYKLHSYAEAADIGGNVNITPFTDLIVANAAGQIAESYFDSNTPADLDPLEIEAQENALQAKLQTVLTALGVETAINLLNTTFSADHSGLDAALDIVRIEVDSDLQVATITNLLENTTVQDSVTNTEDNTDVLLATPATVTTGASDIQAIAALFDALTAAFSGGLPTSTSIEDLFSTDFYEDDNSRGLWLTDITTNPDIIGLNFSSISVSNLDSTTGTATVTFNVSLNGLIDPEPNTWFFARDTTLGWQARGDQRIVDTYFSFHCNDNDGTGSGTGGCGVNTQFWDKDFSNNGTLNAPIASGTVSIINGTDMTTVRDVIYLGTPDGAAPGDVQVYNESSGQYQGDYRGFGTGADEIDSAIFVVGDIIQYDLYTQSLDVTTPSSPQVASGTEVATYTDTLLFAPSLAALYPAATSATLTAINDFSLGNDLTIAWTLAAGTRNSEILVRVSDLMGNRIEIWDDTYSTTATSSTFASAVLDSAAASAAGLDANAASYNLLVRIYAEDDSTGQAHSRDYNMTIPGPGVSFNPANVPGTYNSLWSDDPVHHEFIFSANNTGTVDFGFGLEDFTWSVDGQGRLLVDLGGGGLPDRYTLTSGTIKSGTFSAEVDDDSNGVYEEFPTVDIVEDGGGTTLACNYESGWDDTAFEGQGAPITPNSFADYEGTLASCGTAMPFTAADVASKTFVNGVGVDAETVIFNALGGAAGTEASRGTGSFNDTDTIIFNWYVEAATCSGCTHSYLVQYSDSTIDSSLPSGFFFRETSALTGLNGPLGASNTGYTYHKYSEQSNFSDADRAVGADGEIWFSTDILQ